MYRIYYYITQTKLDLVCVTHDTHTEYIENNSIQPMCQEQTSLARVVVTHNRSSPFRSNVPYMMRLPLPLHTLTHSASFVCTNAVRPSIHSHSRSSSTSTALNYLNIQKIIFSVILMCKRVVCFC